jgi:hypothetical protein
MATKLVIGRTFEWHRNEKKRFKVDVKDSAGNPVDLTGVALQWKLLRSHRTTTAVLTRTSGQFLPPEVGAGSSVPNVAVWDVTDTESGITIPGAPVHSWLYHELWDRDNDLLLVYGGALLLSGQAA